MPRILFISGNFFPELTGIGKYNKEMCEWMADNGFEVSVIATYPYYPQWKIQASYKRRSNWYAKEHLQTAQGNSITIYRCPHYVPQKPTGARRMLLDLSFLLSAFFQVLRLICGKKFEYVITVAPPLTLGVLAVLYKKICKAKFLYHIQDLQIEAARDLKMIKSQLTIRILFWLEKFVMERADVVSSISEGMIAKIKEKTRKDVLLFPNWADLNLMYPIADKAILKQAFGFEPNDKIVLYSGSIGEKQGLESILYVAARQKSNSHIKFVICGSGPYKTKLEAMAEEMNLENIVFCSLQPFDKLNQFLNAADIHLIIQKSDASDLVMPSKLTNILAIGGVAIITANEGCSLYHLVNKHKMGIQVKAEDQEALNEGIISALNNPVEHIRKNALKYAQQYLAIHKVMDNYFMQTFARIIPDSRGRSVTKIMRYDKAKATNTVEDDADIQVDVLNRSNTKLLKI